MSKIGLHITKWANQDWRTSKVRIRSITTNDPWLRVVYREALDALAEAGGELSAEPEALADTLGCPPEEVARCLPILDRIARIPGCRGGLIVEDGTIRNLRVSQAIERHERFADEQREHGRQGGKARRKGHPKGSQGKPKASPIDDDGYDGHRATPRPAQGNPNQPLPLPLPLPLPVAVAGAVAGAVAVASAVAGSGRSGVAGEGSGEGSTARPPAATATPANGDVRDQLDLAIDHDPNDELQTAIVQRCVHLARVDAWRDDRQPTADDVREVLRAVSVTPDTGATLDGLRQASRPWLEQTLRASNAFEHDLEGDAEPTERST
jgi:hypothetical protein